MDAVWTEPQVVGWLSMPGIASKSCGWFASVCDRGFVTVDNLQRTAFLLNASKEDQENYREAVNYIKKQLEELQESGKPIKIEEPIGYGGPNREQRNRAGAHRGQGRRGPRPEHEWQERDRRSDGEGDERGRRRPPG